MKFVTSILLALCCFFSAYAALPPITGTLTVCEGSTTNLSNTVAGGTWVSSNPLVASVGLSTGIVAGLTVGTSNITYTDGVDIATAIVTVHPLPAFIAGSSTVCIGASETLSSSPSGGIWISTNTAVAVMGVSSGVATGISLGTTIISYVLPTGCSRSVVVTVSTTPGAMSGSGSVCVGATTLMTVPGGMPFGTWSSSTTSVATVGTGGVVYGASIGTATITYNGGYCGISTRVVSVSSSCAGTPVPGAISASAAIVCSGTPLVLNLPTYTATCGHIIQWQQSPDGLAWSNIPGATTVPYTHYPTAVRYYRCGITCAGSGSTAYSGPVYVNINYSIGAHSVIAAPTTVCTPTHFYVAACGISSAFSVITFFGDGTADTSAMSTSTLSDAHIYHTYTLPGTYTVKHILRLSGAHIDTVSYSYHYLHCNILPIRFFRDNNTNCLYDAGDVLNTNSVTVQVDSSGIPIDTLSATTGFYYKALGVPGTVYAFRPISISGGLVPYCPFTGVIYDTISALVTSYVTKDFGLVCAPSAAFDLSVVSSALTNGTLQRITILVRNTSCLSVIPVVTLTHSLKYGFIPTSLPGAWTTPLPTSVSGNTLTWNLPILAANSSRYMQVYLSRPATMGLPLMPGDTVNTVIAVSPTTGDANPSDNTVTRIDTLRTPYDPNDIAVSPTGFILPCTKLTYTVRFENMGNDTARNVYVLDTLSPNLDPSTLQIVTATATMNVSVINDGVRNIAKFDFPGINLLDSSRHGENNGMFLFTINARNPLADGTTIMNQVGIYFDENPVVMTNSVTNTIGMAPITGPDNICMGYVDTLFNQMPHGVWASSTPAVATISVLGVVAPVVPGTSVISYTVNNSCTSRTATKTVTVNNVVTDGVSITASSGDTTCTGVPVIFTATPLLGGVTPFYVWQVNGSVTGTGDTYTYFPAAGDTVVVTLSSSEVCAIPSTFHDTAALTVITSELPVANITASPGSTSCAGTPVTFNVLPTAGGDTPGYSWYVNGAMVGSGDNHIYVPTTGDVVYCRMGSNFICRLADTVNSSTITMTVDPLYVPVISISVSPSLTFVSGTSVTFTAGVTGAGPTPSYQWTVNDSIIAGATNSTYTSNYLADYDSVTCRVTGSGVCNITTYNSVFVTVFPVGINDVNGTAGLSLFPNPNNGNFRIKGSIVTASSDPVGITVKNVLGQIVYTQVIPQTNQPVDEEIRLPAVLPSGIYLLDIRQGNNRDVIKFRVQH